MARLHSFLLASLFISQSYLLLVKGDEALIEKTCQTTPNWNFDLCMRTLISNPKSQTADVHGLATIITQRSKTSADEAYLFVFRLLYGSNPAVENVLRQCLEMYSNSKAALQSVLESLGSKDYDGAGINVRAAMDYLGTCRDEFRKNPKISYLTGLAVRENAIAQLSSVAVVIIDGLFPSSL